MIVYVDSSVVLRPLLDQPGKLKTWGEWQTVYSSELLGVECRRAIDRLRLEGLYGDKQVAAAIQQLLKIERVIKRVRLNRAVLERASATMPTVVKTLDAIHLATALAIRKSRAADLKFATHDTQQA